MKDSFIFYRSFYEAIDALPEDKQLVLFRMICELGLNNLEITEQDKMIKAMFTLIEPQIKANNRRYENGKKGGRPITKTKPKDNLDLTKTKPNVNENVNVNDNKKKIVKEKSFTKPSLEEIENYCKERNNNINANNFYDFYESKNWYVGKNKMKDWKACVRTWEQRNTKNKEPLPKWFNNQPEKKQGYTKEEQEIYDYIIGNN